MNESGSNDFIVNPETIKSSPLGMELTDEQCLTLAKIASASGLREGDFLLDEGAKDESIHVIVKGKLEVVKATGAGDWMSLQILHEGDMTGEMGFIDGAEHSAALRALTNTEVFSLNRDAFESLLNEDPQLVYKVMRAIMRTVHTILRRMNAQYVELTNYITKQHGRY